MPLNQQIKQNFNQKIGSGLAIFDIIVRDISLMFLQILKKDFNYFDDKIDKLKKEIGNLLKNQNHIIDERLGYCIIDEKLHFAEFGVSGRKYMIVSSCIYIGDDKKEYVSITDKSDNIYDIKLSNDHSIICNYANTKFIPNIYLNIQNHISQNPIIKDIDSQEELKGVFMANINWIKLGGFFYLNSCFPRTMLMLDYCKQNNISGNLVIDSHRTNKKGYGKLEIIPHFAIEIDGSGHIQFTGKEGGVYIYNDSKYERHIQATEDVAVSRISFDKINKNHNIVDILEMAGFDRAQILSGIDARMSQLYIYHKSTLPK